MITHILKKDLKRKKTMNIIILLFVVLATMFVSSSVNNIVTVMSGTNYYFEKADLGDYIILTMGDNVVGNLDEVLRDNPYVKDYRVDKVIYASEDKFSHDGKKLKCRNTSLIQSIEGSQSHFFDANDNEVTTVEKGKMYTTSDFMKMNDLVVGDKITIKHGDVEMTFELAGKLKDALLGSTFMGNGRFLMCQEDFDVFWSDSLLCNSYGGEVFNIDTDDVKGLASTLSDVTGMGFNKPVSVIRMCYVMDMVVAGVLIVLSICLIIVAFIVLKFTITFTLEEEFREIGVMKAIGIKDKKIRRIYLIKYLALALFGALVGFAASIPFGKMLMKSVSENMVLGNDKGMILNVISASLVVLAIVSYAYRCTAKLKKYSPIDAIRNGQTGERFKKKSTYRIGKSRLKTTSYMALNDVISAPKRYLTVILAFSICSLLVLMLVNTTETMKSDKLVYTFGKPCDAYYNNVDKAMESMSASAQDNIYKVLDQYDELLAENGMPAKTSVEAQFTCKVEFAGESNKLMCQKGIRTKTTDYVYFEGEVPIDVHEVAITKQISEITGAKIGDTLKITVAGKTEDYLVTAYFQTMNQLGEIIRFHEDVETSMDECSGIMSFQFDFTDNPSQATIDERVSKMKDLFESDMVYNAADYCKECISVVDTMKAVEYLLLGLTLVVVILVTILMERSFISDEKGEIAILKAVGFSDAKIISWHAKRFIIVGAVAVFVAVLLSVPATHLCITPIFGMMGLESLSYVIDYLQVFLIFPAIILGVTLVSAVLTATYTKTIKCRDTASIE